MNRIAVGARLASLLALFVFGLPNVADAQCAEGRVANEQTQGRCCWPGQTWNPDTALCGGVPGCPAGRVAQGDDCVLQAGVGAAPGASTAVQAQPVSQPAAPGSVPTAPAGYGAQPQPAYGQQQYQAVPAQGLAPAATRTEMRVNKGLLIPGIIMFSVGYGIAVVSAGLAEYGWLAIPFAGPFILMGELDSSYTSGVYIALGAWGLVQVAGALMFILGIVLKREVQVRADLGNGRSIALQPWDASGGGGLQLVGEF